MQMSRRSATQMEEGRGGEGRGEKAGTDWNELVDGWTVERVGT